VAAVGRRAAAGALRRARRERISVDTARAQRGGRGPPGWRVAAIRIANAVSSRELPSTPRLADHQPARAGPSASCFCAHRPVAGKKRLDVLGALAQRRARVRPACVRNHRSSRNSPPSVARRRSLVGPRTRAGRRDIRTVRSDAHPLVPRRGRGNVSRNGWRSTAGSPILEEQRAAWQGHLPARRSAHRAGERALLAAEQLGAQHGLGSLHRAVLGDTPEPRLGGGRSAEPVLARTRRARSAAAEPARRREITICLLTRRNRRRRQPAGPRCGSPPRTRTPRLPRSGSPQYRSSFSSHD